MKEGPRDTHQSPVVVCALTENPLDRLQLLRVPYGEGVPPGVQVARVAVVRRVEGLVLWTAQPRILLGCWVAEVFSIRRDV